MNQQYITKNELGTRQRNNKIIEGEKRVLGIVDEELILAAAKQTPPQHCQHFVVALVSGLEAGGQLAPGTAESLKGKVSMTELEREYLLKNPVALPLEEGFAGLSLKPRRSPAFGPLLKPDLAPLVL